MVGHVAPEAVHGGPIAAVQTATRSRSTSSRAASTSTSPTTRSPAACEAYEPPVEHGNGVLGKYAKLVSSASEGAVTR